MVASTYAHALAVAALIAYGARALAGVIAHKEPPRCRSADNHYRKLLICTDRRKGSWTSESPSPTSSSSTRRLNREAGHRYRWDNRLRHALCPAPIGAASK